LFLQGFFHSNEEHYPWLQIKLSDMKNLSSVSIVNRQDSNGWRLANIVVRAGLDELKDSSNGAKKIDINHVCGTYLGPGQDGKTYTIKCDTAILAKYVTVQIVPNSTYPHPLNKTYLQINEIVLN
jgi:hypothetical protein